MTSAPMISALSSFAKAELYSMYFSKAANAQARSLYEEASNADKTFGRPCAELAYAILQAYLYNWLDADFVDPKQKMFDWAYEALKRDPDDPNNKWVMANVHLYRKEFPEAVSGYAALGNDKLNTSMPGEEWAYPVDYADLLLLTGNPKQAISIVKDQVLQNCPVPEKWFYWVLAWAYYVDGQHQASLDALANFPNPRNAIRKNVIANLAACGQVDDAKTQAKTFLLEEKAQKITYADPGEPVIDGILLVEERVPFQLDSVRDRWTDDLTKAFTGLVQP